MLVQVLHLDVCDPYDDVLELVVLPRVGRTFNHGKSSVVLWIISVPVVRVIFNVTTHKFVIFDVQEDEFGPEVCALCSLDDLGDVDAGDEKLQVLHDCKSGVSIMLCEV